jgi:hypothetical protein
VKKNKIYTCIKQNEDLLRKKNRTGHVLLDVRKGSIGTLHQATHSRRGDPVAVTRPRGVGWDEEREWDALAIDDRVTKIADEQCHPKTGADIARTENEKKKYLFPHLKKK